MEKKNIGKQFILSIFSFKDYPSFIKTHGGKVFLYALLLTSLTYIITFVIPTFDAIPYIFQLNTTIVDEYVPYFEIENGSFYIDKPVLYEDEEGAMLIYATSDDSFPVDMAREVLGEYLQGVIINRDNIVIKQATGALSDYSFSMMPNLTRDDLYGLIPLIKFFVVLVYILVYIGYIGVYLFGTLVCALIGQVVNLFIKAPVTFGSIFKLTVYARTVPILIKMLFALFSEINFHFMLFYALFILYLVLALRMVKNGSNTTMSTESAFPDPYRMPEDDEPREN